MAIRWNYLKKKVQEVLIRSGIKGAPVDLNRIAEEFNIRIKKEKPEDDDISGMFYKDENGDSVIGVNSNHHETRQNFSIAHELGHIILHATENFHIDDKKLSPIMYRNSISSSGTEELEVEANQFAAELLMPEEFLKADIKKYFSQHKDIVAENFIKDIATLYAVSEEALIIRLTKLKYIG